MEEKHRKAIQRNFTSLVEQTDLDSVVTLLYEKGVFLDYMIDTYRDTNKDLRTRKRQLYRDIERRGPQAFNHLIEVLTETAHWDLVRLLTPDSILKQHSASSTSMPNIRRTLAPPVPNGHPSAARTPRLPQAQSANPDFAETNASTEPYTPSFTVVKSVEFHGGVGSYTTRKRERGITLIITNSQFDNRSADPRNGADIDHTNLKYLFSEIGFHKILAYNNLTYKEMEETIRMFTRLPDLEHTECVFIIISSHGYARAGTNDVDIRCKDGILMSTYYIFKQFNNQNCPMLNNIPKVFIFQTCRGGEEDMRKLPTSRTVTTLRPPETDGARMQPDRLYSDILIANATIPGFVSYRDPLEGSWYVQALCRVFAEHAHDTHVDDLFTLVDEALKQDFGTQTSSVDRWGFNKRLFLHPGLVEDTKPSLS